MVSTVTPKSPRWHFLAIVTVCLAAVFLIACQPIEDVATGNGLAAHTVLDEKALYAAEAAFNVPAQAYIAADEADLLSPEHKAAAKALLLKSYEALQLARKAYAVGDAATFAAKVVSAKAFAEQARVIVPSIIKVQNGN